ncbi:MAG: YfiH family protein [Oceanicoccus sp.]|jgi:YfiH family protein
MIERGTGDFVKANWPAPPNIVALSTVRAGGYSKHPFSAFNLAKHVGDSERFVDANRQKLLRSCEGLKSIQWLTQLHGENIVDLPFVESGSVAMDSREIHVPEADASYTTAKSIACAVLTADCLPLLFCDDNGIEVAAVHAGWRGLAAGILEQTARRFSADEKHIMVWIGPAISQQNFEVGSEVKEAFMDCAAESSPRQIERCFKKNATKPNHYFADLAQIARVRLGQIGIKKVYGGNVCNFERNQQFFSYRRDKVTGRMATLIYIK